jgi:hypothetical protein
MLQELLMILWSIQLLQSNGYDLTKYRCHRVTGMTLQTELAVRARGMLSREA